MAVKKPLLGLMGLSDGDPIVHEKSKDIVQHQLDVIKEALLRDGRVDVVVADNATLTHRNSVYLSKLFQNII